MEGVNKGTKLYLWTVLFIRIRNEPVLKRLVPSDLLLFRIFHTLRSMHKVIAAQIRILISLALAASLWWQSTEIRHWVRSTISPGMLRGNYSNPHKSWAHQNTPLLALHNPLLFVLASMAYKEHILEYSCGHIKFPCLAGCWSVTFAAWEFYKSHSV